MKRWSIAFALIAPLTALAGLLPIGSVSASTSEEIGQALYLKKGCFECHGQLGQGSIMSGPPLVPGLLELDAMQKYVRSPIGQMPVYSSKIMSREELASIRAYLMSIPQGQAPESIPLLAVHAEQGAQTSQPSTGTAEQRVPGAGVFATHCAACHGAHGGGGIGPSLLGLGKKRSTPDIAAFVRDPSGAMPRLYPSTINSRDVDEVAKFVAALH